MDKRNVVYTQNGILFRLETEGHPARATARMSLEDITLSETSQ